MPTCYCVNCITPPHILKRLVESQDLQIRQAALHTLILTSRLRGERKVRRSLAAAIQGNSRRTVFDCDNFIDLSMAEMARNEGDAVSADSSVNRAFDGLGITRDFLKEVFDRSSIDDRGMRLDGYVHYDNKYNNAFWDGARMVFGDGDGLLFADFTESLDVIGHELIHGVTESIAGLRYHNQSGALNESISDVFGSLVKQWHLQQTADQADWLIGAAIFTPNVNGDALRSMKAPGSAYEDIHLGKDPQPDHMRKYVNLPDTDAGDFGGVHINSGIPNKAFYLAAMGIGGHAWEAPGQIWYEALKASSAKTEFEEFAETTYFKADQLFGSDSPERKAVLEAWREVGVRIPSKSSRSRRPSRTGATSTDRAAEENIASLTKQIEHLSKQVKSISKEISIIKERA